MHTHHWTYGTTLRSRVLTAALLGIVSVLAACKPTTEPVERREPQGPDALIDPGMTLPTNLLVDFDASAYGPIDVLRAARTQYGSAATLTSVSDHLYGWRAVVNGRYLSIDMQRAVADQYGAGFVLGAVGVHLYDWRAIRWSGLNNRVVPVMPIASDLFFNVDAVRTGLANFRSVLITIRNWYDLRMGGESFHYAQPLIVPLQSTQTAAEWNWTSSLTQNEDHRWDLLDSAIVEYQRSYPNPGSSLRVMLAPFTGSSPDVWLGAASTGRFAVAPQRATSIVCPTSGPLDYRCADATYAIGHELGHTFGLAHSCDAYPKDLRCSSSIMHTGKPWDAILLPGEIATLQPLSFFW